MTRTERQKKSIEKWRYSKGNGTIKGCVGYGKSRCAIEIIKEINKKRGYEIIVGVIVPTSPLQSQWLKLKEKHNLNLLVYTIQSFNETTDEKIANLWIYDEIHLYMYGDTFNKIFDKTKSEFKLGLTGTLKEEELPIINNILPIVDEITFEYASKMGWVAGVKEYNLLVDLSKEELDGYNAFNDGTREKYSVFDYDVDYLRYCRSRSKDAYFPSRGETEPRRQPGSQFVARHTQPFIGEDGTIYKEIEQVTEDVVLLKGELLWEEMTKIAKSLSEDFRTLKEMMYKFPSCIQKAKEVIDYMDMKTITFGESTEAADDLGKLLGERAKVYHSNIKTIVTTETATKSYKGQAAADRNASKLNGKSFMKGDEWVVEYPRIKKITKTKQREIMLEELEKGKIDAIISAKSFIVGLDVEGLQLGVNLSTTSNNATHEQKIGRASRKEGDKISYMINIIPKGTKAIYKFREAQKNSKNVKTIYNEVQIEL